ncbi:MAG: hypothetical protein IJS32_04090 [Kiritimatiellae bacterium]|nr:hypothetical protein [Kiritimatiellia bacterium]
MGNVIALTDASGSVTATFRYTPFGQLSARTGSVLPRYLFSSKEFDRTVGLYYYGYRYYAPRLGRWMTRDPIEEKGGINVYSFLGNASADRFDTLGLAWKIQRTGKLQAIATVDCDTLNTLAPMTGLSLRDYGKWLEPDDGQPMPQASFLLLRNRRFKIPNTVYAIWAGNMGEVGQWWVEWSKNIAHLRGKGFRVMEFDVTMVHGDKVPFERYLVQAENLKVLHGIYFWGHGNDDGELGTKRTTILDVRKLQLPYKLAFTAIFACDSNVAVKQISSGALGSVSRGHNGLLIPVFPGSRFNLPELHQGGP